MSRYDGLIIPRSYSEYINKTDAATLSQALQLGGVLDSAPTEDSVKAVKSGGVYTALQGLETEIGGKQDALTFDDVPTEDSDNPVKSSGLVPVDEVASDNMHAVTSSAVYKSINPSTTTIIESTQKRTVSVTNGQSTWWSMNGYSAPAVPPGKRLIRTFPRCSNNGVFVTLGSIYSTNQDVDIPSIATISDSTSSVQIWLCIEVADI